MSPTIDHRSNRSTFSPRKITLAWERRRWLFSEIQICDWISSARLSFLKEIQTLKTSVSPRRDDKIYIFDRQMESQRWSCEKIWIKNGENEKERKKKERELEKMRSLLCIISIGIIFLITLPYALESASNKNSPISQESVLIDIRSISSTDSCFDWRSSTPRLIESFRSHLTST